MKTVCIVQARMGSTRLPGKVLLPLNGRTVIGEVLSRCKRIPGVDEVVCAIPERDDQLAKEAAKYAAVYRGPEQDVLARYHGAAVKHGADIVVRITGDCPQLNWHFCSRVIGPVTRCGMGYAGPSEPRTFPQGWDCEAFTMSALDLANQHAGPDEREHVTTWMRKDGAPFSQARLTYSRGDRHPDCDKIKPLDTWDDYAVICAAFGHEADQRLRAA